MKICALVDFMGTCLSSPEQEYQEIKDCLVGMLGLDPDKVTFRENVFPHQLANEACDIYVIDFGGLLPGSEDGVLGHFRSLVEQAEEKPNTLFVIWSQFTFSHFYRTAFEEKYGSDFKFPNVVLYSAEDEDIERICAWFGRKPPTVEPLEASCADDEFGIG